MSDYLTRMVERTLGLSEVVQPFVPAVFARDSIGKNYRYPPHDIAEEIADDGEYNSEHLPLAVSDENNIPIPDALENNSETSTNDRTVDEPILKVQNEKLMRPVAIKQSGQGSQYSDSDIQTEDEDHQNISAKTERASVGGVFPSKGAPIAKVPEMTERAKTTLSTKKDIKGVAKPSTQTVPIAVTKKTSVKEKNAINKRKYLVPAMEKEAVHPISSMIAEPTNTTPPKPFSGRNETSPLLPTIKVTIGRIDVRAVMQQTPSPKRMAAPAPKLSLDDYLKKRSGGQR